jgi:alpha-tubulin suppressor-like RCC1 family protein
VANRCGLSLVCVVTHTCVLEQHMLALLGNGAVYSWGLGVFGQLGHGTLHNERWPRLVVTICPRAVRWCAMFQI